MGCDLSVVVFRITEKAGFRDSRGWIPDSKGPDSGFRIPKAKKCWIPDSGFPYMGRMLR